MYSLGPGLHEGEVLLHQDADLCNHQLDGEVGVKGLQLHEEAL